MGSGCSSLPCDSCPPPVASQVNTRGARSQVPQVHVSIVAESERVTTLPTAMSNPNTRIVSGLPVADASPSVTPPASLKSSIVLDDDAPQLPPRMLLPPRRDSKSSESRASQLESRVLFNVSAPSMPSFQTSGLLRGQSVTARSLSSAGGGGGEPGNSTTTTTTVASVADPRLCQSVYSSLNVSGKDALPSLERSEAWMEAAAVEMGLRCRE